jgi:glycosyltransferase involved in cell wall biosynthesis
MESALISIVLVCYNHEKFVVEAIDGVLSQTFGPLDITVIDDCSSDRTADIIGSKLAGRPDVRFIRNNENMTWWGACDLGLKAAQGRFVVLSCGDDVMAPDMIAEMADVWRRDNVSLVTTNVEYIDEDSNLLGRTARPPGVPADDSFETLARDGSNACCFGASIGFERALYETFGLPPSYLEACDIMLPFYAHLLKGARFIPRPLLRYRVHANNSALSLRAERAGGLERLELVERMMGSHLAHAVLMQQELDRLQVTMPSRYREVAGEIAPLITGQIVEFAKKFVNARIEMHGLCRAMESAIAPTS